MHDNIESRRPHLSLLADPEPFPALPSTSRKLHRSRPHRSGTGRVPNAGIPGRGYAEWRKSSVIWQAATRLKKTGPKAGDGPPTISAG